MLVDYNNYYRSIIIILSLLNSYWLLENISLENIFKFAIFSIFIVIALVDLQDMIIPDSLVGFNLILVIVFYIINKRAIFIKQPLNSFEILSSIIFIALLMGIVIIFDIIYNKEIMGYGDIKLLFLIGLMSGITKLMYTIFIASLIALVIELLKKRKKSVAFPFGPYLIIGFVFVNLF